MKFKNVIDTTAEVLGDEMYQPFRVNLIGQKPYTDKIYRNTFGGIQVYYTTEEPSYDIGRDGKEWG